MKAIITVYSPIVGQGLILRNNFVEELMEYDLKEFLMKYDLSLEEIAYQVDTIKNSLKQRGYSSIIEASKDFDYHIRFIS